jgi:PAS domain S-box-containing protein
VPEAHHGQREMDPLAGWRADDMVGALIESVADALYVVDSEGRVRFANPAAVALLGYGSPEELIGRMSHETIHYKHPDGTPFPAEECPLLRPRTTGEVVRVDEDWFVRKDGGMFPVSYSSAPVTTDTERAAVVVFRDITERLRAEEALREQQAQRARLEELRASRARIVAAADNERRRIAHDLHDGAQQWLMNVLVTIRLAEDELGAAPAEARALLERAADETERALQGLRELAAGVHPALLTNRGLAAAVEALTARAPHLVELHIPADRFPAPVEAAAYFIIAEALANAAKHADAGQVVVEVVAGRRRLTIDVRDDGVGGAELDAGGGLRGLEDRVAALDGSLHVVSPPGAGTHLHAEIAVP